MKINVVTFLLIISNAAHSMDYINKYFPENSVIREKHNSEVHGTAWFGFDSGLRSACDGLNATYRRVASAPGLHSTDALILLNRYSNTILANQNDETKEKEQEWVFELQYYLQKKIEDEAKAKDQSLKRNAAIRAALENIDQRK